ncbi:conserved hypothetical protein [Curtobacterium sp. 8I-2]|nr:conserved hypothetical protein [Curtobacterium sp. 8I-2]
MQFQTFSEKGVALRFAVPIVFTRRERSNIRPGRLRQLETERGPTMMISATTPFRGIRGRVGTPFRVR